MSIQLVIIVAYVAVLFGISFYAKRLAANGSTNFLFAGRNMEMPDESLILNIRIHLSRPEE